MNCTHVSHARSLTTAAAPRRRSLHPRQPGRCGQSSGSASDRVVVVIGGAHSVTAWSGTPWHSRTSENVPEWLSSKRLDQRRLRQRQVRDASLGLADEVHYFVTTFAQAAEL